MTTVTDRTIALYANLTSHITDMERKRGTSDPELRQAIVFAMGAVAGGMGLNQTDTAIVFSDGFEAGAKIRTDINERG